MKSRENTLFNRSNISLNSTVLKVLTVEPYGQVNIVVIRLLVMLIHNLNLSEGRILIVVDYSGKGWVAIAPSIHDDGYAGIPLPSSAKWLAEGRADQIALDLLGPVAVLAAIEA